MWLNTPACLFLPVHLFLSGRAVPTHSERSIARGDALAHEVESDVAFDRFIRIFGLAFIVLAGSRKAPEWVERGPSSKEP